MKNTSLNFRIDIQKSVNPAYPPVVLGIQEDMASLFRVIGKVLWGGREYN